LPFLGPLFAGGVGIVFLTYAAISGDQADAKFQAARKKATERAEIATRLAMGGIPPEGPLAMLQNDPELRGEELFAKNCAVCHVLGNLGDKEKANASTLDHWGTEPWILGMLHDPDDNARFGKTPFKEKMPSFDKPPKDPKEAADFKAMPADDMKAVAAFLAAEGDMPGDKVPADAPRKNEALKKRGAAVFEESCTGCHLYKGKGDNGGAEVAPEFSGYGSLAWVRAQIANPATPATYREKVLDPALKGHMPRFDAELSAKDIDLLAVWLRNKTRGLSSPGAGGPTSEAMNTAAKP
jgi:ubiquinol-cytochrome c reductase cytochrome b subunit